MTYESIRRFTCDRCGGTEEVPTMKNDEPTGWAGVRVTKESDAPLTSFNVLSRRLTLCPGCAPQLREFMRNSDTVLIDRHAFQSVIGAVLTVSRPVTNWLIQLGLIPPAGEQRIPEQRDGCNDAAPDFD